MSEKPRGLAHVSPVELFTPKPDDIKGTPPVLPEEELLARAGR
jgi:hypothetical protein